MKSGAFMRASLGVLVVVTACAHQREPSLRREDFRAVGKPPATLPADVAWCSTEVKEAAGSTGDARWDDCDEKNPFCAETAARFEDCAVGPLNTELPSGFGRFVGKVVLHASLDDGGMVTEVCLLSSDMGDTPATLSCIASKARGYRLRRASREREFKWPISFWLD